jgi:uncharacterized protein (TIGR03083 family)
MKPAGPLFTVDLFSVLDQKLMEVLKSLSEEDWSRQTSAPLWTVKDIAAHLLDGNVRNLSIGRDGYWGVRAENIDSYQSLVQFLNQLNHTWVTALQRMSPVLLIELLATTGKQYADYLQTLDPYADAIFSVAWAGEDTSPNWFHIAREYTEKWHHQQQIRLAVGKEAALLTKELYYPCLDTFMRALPHHYQSVEANENTVICFVVSGDIGQWHLLRTNSRWELFHGCDLPVTCHVEIDAAIAWRMFTKGISKELARKQVQVTGKAELGERILDMLAVMA